MRETCVRKSSGRLADSSDTSITTKYKHDFEREARNLAKFNSSRIVRVKKIVAQNNTFYIITEFIDGLSLEDYITSRPNHSLLCDDALRITAEVARGLQEMHRQGMLHLDMKPRNVMLDNEGSAHIIDFGLSRQLDADGLLESRTSIGQGTSGYAPIEQLDADNTAPQPSIDIYALGATLFKMITGNTPPSAVKVATQDAYPKILGDKIVQKCIEAGLPMTITDSIASLVCNMMHPDSSKRINTLQPIINQCEFIIQQIVKSKEPNNISPQPQHYPHYRLKQVLIITFAVLLAILVLITLFDPYIY